MIARTITPHLDELAKSFRVVSIMGPRQSGKTTLARNHFPNHRYVNLEDIAVRQLAKSDPTEFFRQHPGPVILDEVQRVPELLSAIQVLSDGTKKNGQFILTGSHQPDMRAKVSQSLAGRAAILELLPLSISELKGAGIVMDRDDYIFNGFMPRIYDEHVSPELLYANYYRTYVERDVRQLINLSNQHAFEVFIKLLAGRVGQLVNLSSMSNDIGVSSMTLASWLSVLEASYLVFRLPCYFNNFGKRQIKTAKIYFTEVGLAAYLLGIESPAQAARDPLFGGLFENMVVLEALKARCNIGKEPELYYFRDKRGLEVDLILNKGRTLRPIEIKSARTYDASFTQPLKKFVAFAGSVSQPSIVYAGDLTPTINGIRFVNFADTADIITAPVPK